MLIRVWNRVWFKVFFLFHFLFSIYALFLFLSLCVLFFSLVPTSLKSVGLCTSFWFGLGLNINRCLLGSSSCFCFLLGTLVTSETSIWPSSQTSRGFNENSLHPQGFTQLAIHGVESRLKGEIICSFLGLEEYQCGWSSCGCVGSKEYSYVWDGHSEWMGVACQAGKDMMIAAKGE